MTARAQPLGITAVPIWGDNGSGSGPTPPATEDRFEANILVGNTVNGDSATAQSAPFQYIADTGDGAGVRAALAVAAANPATRYRIRVRPGLYTFPADGVFPIEIPTNCTLEGSGIDRTIFRQDTTNWNVFQLLAGDGIRARAELRDCTVEVSDQNAQTTPTGPYVVDVLDRAIAQNVRIFARTQIGVVTWSGREFFRASGTQPHVLDCIVTSQVLGGSYTSFTNIPAGVRIGRTSVTTHSAQIRVRIEPQDSGIAAGTSQICAVAMPASVTVQACRIEVSGSGCILGVLRGTGHLVDFEIIAQDPLPDFGGSFNIYARALAQSVVRGTTFPSGSTLVYPWSVDSASEFNRFEVTHGVQTGSLGLCQGESNSFVGCSGEVATTFSGDNNVISGGQWRGGSVEVSGDGNTFTGAYFESDFDIQGTASRNGLVGCRVGGNIVMNAGGTDNLVVSNRYAGTLTVAGTTPEVANNVQE